MKIDVLARAWGTPAGASNGMAMAAGFLAETLRALGHEVRQLAALEGFGADLVITTISATWHHTAPAWAAHRSMEHLVYWHHASGVPEGHGALLAAPPVIERQTGWARQVVLPPSSWAAEAGGECTGGDIVVAGAGPPKGGHVALAAARLCPDLRWYVLQGRSAPSDREPWLAIPGAELAPGVVAPDHLLGRARAILSPTRFEVHPLLLVEAAVRGIPIVCTDMPATRAAAGENAIYVPMQAPAEDWAAALRGALAFKAWPHLKLRPYAEVVADALEQLVERRAAA